MCCEVLIGVASCVEWFVHVWMLSALLCYKKCILWKKIKIKYSIYTWWCHKVFWERHYQFLNHFVWIALLGYVQWWGDFVRTETSVVMVTYRNICISVFGKLSAGRDECNRFFLVCVVLGMFQRCLLEESMVCWLECLSVVCVLWLAA